MDQRNSTRRRYLQAAGGATAAALAGCLGDIGGDGSTDTDSMTENGMTEDDMTEGGTTDDSMTEDGMTEDDMTDDSMTGDGTMSTTFHVVVENVSTGDTLRTMDGSVAVPLSPGVYAVHSGMARLFAPGEAAGDGLESLAEDGAPDGLADEVAGADGVLDSGTFATPTGADEAGPLGPGGTYEFEVEASADADPSLSLATMFVQSNDLFYAPADGGVALFEDGEPVGGDVTDSFGLWDAGTERNQPPGEGGDQAPRQSGPDTGTDEMGSVRRIGDVDDGHDYPAVDEVLSVRVSTM